MHPAPSVIVFSVLSGAGFGLLAFLALGLPIVLGTDALLLWGAGYALAVTGLVASTFHLGNPRRALKAYTQWRTSWLSREAWAATGTLVLLAPVALAAVFGVPMPAHFGIVGTVLALLTVFSTAQIYAQLATVPRWNHGSVPAIFLVFSLAGGAILAGAQIPAAVLTVLLAPLLVWSFRDGDTRFARRGGRCRARPVSAPIRACWPRPIPRPTTSCAR
ncbi:dimethyl sulfoxide reductase anchor subunit family protein [Albidovulum sp.]|uniref:dimethyl sulfoxide reductase anchor subunit family protein n=1 Tax=Albidovulum sp. TaxID=1872424 RepID=UPI0035294DAD